MIVHADIEELARNVKHYIGSDEVDTYIEMLVRNEKCITMRERYTAQCVSVDARDAAHEHAIQKYEKMSLALNRIIDSLVSAKERERAVRAELQRRNDLNIDIENEYGDDDDDDEMASPQEQSQAEQDVLDMLMIENQVAEIKQTKEEAQQLVVDALDNLQRLDLPNYRLWYTQNITAKDNVKTMLMNTIQRYAPLIPNYWTKNEYYRDTLTFVFSDNPSILTNQPVVLFLPFVITEYVQSYPLNMALYHDVISAMYDTRLYANMTLFTETAPIDQLRKNANHLTLLNVMIKKISDSRARMNKRMFADYFIYLMHVLSSIDEKHRLAPTDVKQSLNVAARDYPQWLFPFMAEITRTPTLYTDNLRGIIRDIVRAEDVSIESRYFRDRETYLCEKAERVIGASGTVEIELAFEEPKVATARSSKRRKQKKKKSKKRK